jgi:hypothetical protein
MKNFSKSTFIISTIVFGLLLVPSFQAAWGEEEGTLGTNIIWMTFAKLFHVLRFPTHTLLWSLICKCGATIYFGSLLLNCLFFGLLTERLFPFLKVKSDRKTDNTAR